MWRTIPTLERAPRSQRPARPLWLWPTVAGGGGFVVAEVLARLDLPPEHWAARWSWPGDTQAASTMVQAVATAAITATTLTFSVTVVALQLASQQFSPRLLREFTRDPVTRVVLSTLTCAFVFALTVARHLHASKEPPVVALTMTMLLGLASFAAVLAFITHIVRALRIDSMMRAVHDETSRAIDASYPPHPADAPADSEDAGEVGDEGGAPGLHTTLNVAESGFVRLVHVAALVEAARQADAMVRILVRPGDHVVRGAPMAQVWGPDPSRVEDAVRDCVVVAFERTLEQDAAYGFRQLEDIAVKALSPGINDPVTAAHAVGHMSDLLVRLVGCRLGPTRHTDAAGVPRAVVPDRDLRYYLDLACGQLRRYATREPTVLVALLRMLRDVAVATRDDQQRAEIERQADLITRTASEALLPEDAEPVHDLHERVRLALAGDSEAAFADRAGETRSL